MTIDFEDLTAPFSTDKISWRVGSTTKDKSKGMALAYIDARDVYDRFDEVCGPAGWRNRYPHAGQKTVCEIDVKIDGEWVTKSNGAGDTNFEGDKGALSDSIKRAAVVWGVGRYLYGMNTPWVEIQPAGRSFVIKQEEYAKLNEYHDKCANNEIWGTHSERATLKAYLQSIHTFCKTASDIQEFKSENEGMYSQLRKSAREQVDRVMQTIIDNDPSKQHKE